MDVSWHPLAAREYDDAYWWYRERNPEAATRFVGTVSKAVEDISRYPERYPTHTKRTRRYLLPRFPYQVIYSLEPDVVAVISIHHCSRNPAHWENRI